MRHPNQPEIPRRRSRALPRDHLQQHADSRADHYPPASAHLNLPQNYYPAYGNSHPGNACAMNNSGHLRPAATHPRRKAI